MTLVEASAKIEGKLRPLVVSNFPSWASVFLFSQGRKLFLRQFVKEKPKKREIPKDLEVVCWGLRFQSPLMNAAGMFKDEDAYRVVSAQGAGAYLRGTDVWNPYKGNKKALIRNPVVSFPRSGASLNWLGLPGDGIRVNFLHVLNAEKREGCPFGCSLMGDPRIKDEGERLEYLVEGMLSYASAGVDFLEDNFSCPNTGDHTPDLKHLRKQVRYVGDNFISIIDRKVPVIAKLSVDWPVRDVKETMDILFDAGFSGVNFGNTSVNYLQHGLNISVNERKLYKFFFELFGGGVGGRPLKEKSLELASEAARYVREGPPEQEFHVIRTGGIESWSDVLQSRNEGISLNGWFTGYWEAFAKHGHDVYVETFREAA